MKAVGQAGDTLISSSIFSSAKDEKINIWNSSNIEENSSIDPGTTKDAPISVSSKIEITSPRGHHHQSSFIPKDPNDLPKFANSSRWPKGNVTMKGTKKFGNGGLLGALIDSFLLSLTALSVPLLGAGGLILAIVYFYGPSTFGFFISSVLGFVGMALFVFGSILASAFLTYKPFGPKPS